MIQQAVREKHDGRLGGSHSIGLWLRLLTCSTIIEKRIRRRFAAQFDTTLPRFDVLAALERQDGGLTMGELSRRLLVSNGNVTALVRQLESSGLVTCSPAEDDRRSMVVELTAVGRAHFGELAVAHHRWVEAMLAGLPPERQDLLFELLAELKASIAAEPA